MVAVKNHRSGKGDEYIVNRKPETALKPMQRIFYIGSGASIGVALGMIVGLLLFHDLGVAIAVGAAVALVVGAAIELRTAP
jgi:uncharacterized membrane protein